MKRMKSELKRHQASSATEVSETPSTRSSFDVDISLAQNEIVSLFMNLLLPRAYKHTARQSISIV
jgi:hypothetical protein